jgi:hypothetical protein
MPINFTQRPDPRFYQNIMQFDDGSFTADQMPLNDVITTRGTTTIVTAGLRNITKQNINAYAASYITLWAPPYAQNNALHVLATETSGADYDAATAMFQRINNTRDYSNQLCAAVDLMTFDQLVVYTVPTTGWPVA